MPWRPILYPLAAVAWVLIYANLAWFSSAMTIRVFGQAAADSHLAEAVGFFLLDVPKVLLLLVAVVWGVGVIRSFVTPERTRAFLAGRRETVGNFLAASLGVVTPFCSCSAVPLFLGFVEAGVPLGVTFSFLIAAPMVNEIALVLLIGLAGWRVAGIYLATGVLTAVVAGWVIGRLHMERHLEGWVQEMRGGGAGEVVGGRMSWHERFVYAEGQIREIVGRVWIFVILGIAVGAGIHGYVPQGAFAAIMGRKAWWSVPAVVALGTPFYSNAAGIIPVVQALLEKGASLGTVLAFMMSVIGLSLPEMVILRKVLRPRLIGVFIAVLAVGIMAVGFLFNAIL